MTPCNKILVSVSKSFVRKQSDRAGGVRPSRMKLHKERVHARVKLWKIDANRMLGVRLRSTPVNMSILAVTANYYGRY